MDSRFDMLIAIRDKDKKGKLSDLSWDLEEMRAWVDAQEVAEGTEVSSPEPTQTADDEPSIPATLSSDLRGLAHGFEQAMSAYHSVAVMARNLETVFPQVMFDSEIRKLAETRATVVEKRGDYTIYGVPNVISHDLTDRILPCGL